MGDCVIDSKPHKSGVKYTNDEDRRKGYLAAQLRYANKNGLAKYVIEQF